MTTPSKDYTKLSKKELILELTKVLNKNKKFKTALTEIRDNTGSQMEWEVAEAALKNHGS